MPYDPETGQEITDEELAEILTQRGGGLDPNTRKTLREQEKALKEAALEREELAILKREIVFTKAGIPEDGVGRLFRKAYDGALDAEAIKAEATSYGLLNPPAEPPDPGEAQRQAELSAMQRAANATSGPGSPSLEVQRAAAFADIASATSKDDVMAKFREAAAQERVTS